MAGYKGLPNWDKVKIYMGSDVGRDVQFEAFYRLHHPQVTRYVVRRLRSDVEDIVEEVFITAWRKRESLPSAESEQIIWLYATAKRIIANKVRWKARIDRFRRAQEPLISESTDGTSESTSLLVHSALSRMRAQDREILLLVEWDGCSIGEAAVVLGITPSAAGKRIHSARRAFAEKYQK